MQHPLQQRDDLIVVELFRIALGAEIVVVNVDDVLEVLLLDAELVADMPRHDFHVLEHLLDLDEPALGGLPSVMLLVSTPMALVNVASLL